MKLQNVSENRLFIVYSFPQAGVFIKPAPVIDSKKVSVKGTINEEEIDKFFSGKSDEDFGFKISDARANHISLTFSGEGIDDKIEV